MSEDLRKQKWFTKRKNYEGTFSFDADYPQKADNMSCSIGLYKKGTVQINLRSRSLERKQLLYLSKFLMDVYVETEKMHNESVE